MRALSIPTSPPSLPNLSPLDMSQQFSYAKLSKLRAIIEFELTKVGYVLRVVIVALPTLLCLFVLALYSFL